MPIVVHNSAGGIPPGDGVFSILITNVIPGNATNDCEATCELCQLEFLHTYAMINPGQYCLTVETEAGPFSFPPAVQNYTRPGVLKAKCNPDFAPFFTSRVKDCATGQQVAMIHVAIDCICE
ncbi:MAG: hypothetical protein L7S64_07025 [Longimicrobiales bacterium]|nr:hypothetical protein [Longimicrobiales bacterium]